MHFVEFRHWIPLLSLENTSILPRKYEQFNANLKRAGRNARCNCIISEANRRRFGVLPRLFLLLFRSPRSEKGGESSNATISLKLTDRKGQANHEHGGACFFTFIGPLSSSDGLSASRPAFASFRCRSGCFHIGQRKQIIRTHLRSETSSDYIGLEGTVKIDIS